MKKGIAGHAFIVLTFAVFIALFVVLMPRDRNRFEAALSYERSHHLQLRSARTMIDDYFDTFTAFSCQRIVIQGVRYDLVGVDENYNEIYPEVFVEGRGIWAEDIEARSHIVVIGEAVSLRLFRTVKSIGKSLNIQGTDYRIVGVARQLNPIGRPMNPLFVPISVIHEADTLELALISGRNSGMTFHVFEEMMNRLFESATCYGLEREAALALYPLALLAACALLFLGTRVFSHVRISAREMRIRQSRRLKDAYLEKTIRPLIAEGFVVCAMTAAGLYFLLAALRLISGPITLFPEWMPESLLNLYALYEKIVTQNGMGWAQTVHVTQTVMRIRFFGSAINACVLLFSIYGMWHLLSIMVAERKKRTTE